VIGSAQILLGDCREVMATMPSMWIYLWVPTRLLFQYLARGWTLEHSSLVYDNHLIRKEAP
jgi:hypothetical protein